MKQKIVVFDIDGTLSDLHLGVEFLKMMAGQDAIRGISKELFAQQYDEWVRATDKTAYYDEHFDDYYTSRLVGVERSVFDKAGQNVAAEAFPHFFPDMLAELRDAQKAGYHVLLISKSPEQAVAEISKLLHADGHWGWQFNFDASGAYVDQYTYPNGESDKAFIIQTEVDLHGLTLDGSKAYGDSNGDISMLELVAHPTAVNPEPELLAVAERNNWRIVHAGRDANAA